MAPSLHRLGAPPGGASAAASEPDLGRELDLAHKRIAELEGELSRQARVRAELVHLVAHELRTPITVITGFGRLLLQSDTRGLLSDQQRHFVDESLKACRRLDRFVADLMEAGTDASRPLAIERVEGDLHQVIRGQLESLAPLLEERGMAIELLFAPALPCFGFDPRRIEQVVTNLMTNAIRYGRPKGVVRITTSAERDATGRALVVVAVEDDGCGIPVNDRERLFAPYVRGEGETRGSGLGIGLAICRRIVESHGGSIAVTDPGELGGARFVFTLPLAPSGRQGA